MSQSKTNEAINKQSVLIYRTKSEWGGYIFLLLVLLLSLFSLYHIRENFPFIIVLNVILLLIFLTYKVNRLVIWNDKLVVEKKGIIPILTHHKEFNYGIIKELHIEKGQKNPFWLLIGQHGRQEGNKIIVKLNTGEETSYIIDCNFAELYSAYERYLSLKKVR